MDVRYPYRPSFDGGVFQGTAAEPSLNARAERLPDPALERAFRSAVGAAFDNLSLTSPEFQVSSPEAQLQAVIQHLAGNLWLIGHCLDVHPGETPDAAVRRHRDLVAKILAEGTTVH